MKLPPYCAAWPESWRTSWEYDRREQVGVDGWRAYQYGYRTRSRVLLDAVRRVTPPGGRILDVGAAQGSMTLQLAEAGYEVTWNDLRAELAGYVQLKHTSGTVHYRPGNIFDGAPERYDTVIAAEVIEHVAHPDELLAQLAGLLAEGGRLVLSTPNGRNLLNRLPNFSDIDDPSAHEAEQFKPDADGHIFLLTPRELEDLARSAGLVVDELTRCQTYAAHAVERTLPRVLRSTTALKAIGRVDRALLQAPVVNDRLAVQLVTVLRRR